MTKRAGCDAGLAFRSASRRGATHTGGPPASSTCFSPAPGARPRGCSRGFNGAPIAFGALAQMAEGVAIELRRRGIRRGDRVVTMMRNSPAALATMFGLAQAGSVWVPLNAQLRGPGLGYVLDHCEPALVVADPELMPVITASGARLSGMPVLSAGEIET